MGIDVDPDMIAIAQENGRTRLNVEFHLDDHHLGRTSEDFDVILCRHAPYDGRTVLDHLRPGGYFLAQDAGERNMANVKAILGQDTTTSTFDPGALAREGLRIIATMEYDVEYVVEDVESIVFGCRRSICTTRTSPAHP